jgi:uncharacterized membrane protein YfcA
MGATMVSVTVPYLLVSVLGALTIGLTLALLGSGGSILTVPVLVYMLGHDEKIAIAESLAIVGGIALVGMLSYARVKLVDWNKVLMFGVPSIAGAYMGAWLGQFVSGALQLLLFAVVMLLAAVSMYRRAAIAHGDSSTRKPESHTDNPAYTGPALVFTILPGLGVGLVTGLVGVGGGFLIVPALVVIGKLPVRLAIGTSLSVIAMNSVVGFLKHLTILHSYGRNIDFFTVIAFFVVGVIGSLLGTVVNQRLNQRVLQTTFSVVLVLISAWILTRELPHVVSILGTHS